MNSDNLAMNLRGADPKTFKAPAHYDRGQAGYFAYAAGMDASMQEKAKFLPYVKEGLILEMGCGNGTVLELLSAYSQNSQIVGVDISDKMLQLAGEREYPNPNIDLQKGDVSDLIAEPGSVDSIVFCSIMHEVYSYDGYSLGAVDQTLETSAKMLSPGGRLIIRDAPKTSDESVYLRFKNLKTHKKFVKFANDFGPYKIDYDYDGEMVRVKENDSREFLSKYIYEQNWDIEVMEQFGVYTVEEWRSQLQAHGFRVVGVQSYLIDWLKKTHYEKDVDMFQKKNGIWVPKEYPDSTMILVGEKI
ncbi:methyltransferase domain-containing protein [Candidatus Woesearchaeota archaeon]|nr:methyltransferase domain-containing protein [Candidatus Woesearchaeota archaeon]